MTSKCKNKKQPGQRAEKENEEQQHEEANASSPVASQAGNVMDGEEPVNLTLILREIRDFRKDIKKLEDIKGELAKTNTRLDKAEVRIEGNEERLQNTEEALAEILKIHEQLQWKLTDQEGRSRRENVRIYGVPEGAEGGPGSMIPFMERLLRGNLDIPDAKDMQIERAHWPLAHSHRLEPSPDGYWSDF